MVFVIASLAYWYTRQTPQSKHSLRIWRSSTQTSRTGSEHWDLFCFHFAIFFFFKEMPGGWRQGLMLWVWDQTQGLSGAFSSGATTIKSIPLQHATHSKALRYGVAHLSPQLGLEHFIPPGRVPASLTHFSLPSNYQPIAIPDQLLLHKLASSSVSQQRSQTLHGLCGHLVLVSKVSYGSSYCSMV